MLYIDPGRVEREQKLRQETGHCDLFTFTIYYLFEDFSRACMQIKVHDTGMNRVHSELKVSSLHTTKDIIIICCCMFILVLS